MAVSIRLLIPAIGSWVVVADLDLPSTAPLPTGRVTVSINGETLSGTVDPRESGRFGEKASVRVIAGAGAWNLPVKKQGFHNDAGLTTLDIAKQTAAVIGESVVEPAPLPLGVDWVRTEGMASRVLNGRPWYIDAAGVTQISTWPARPLPSGADVLMWDPDQRRAMVASDAIVWPGTTITDARFGEVVVRDVEHVFSEAGARAEVWCTPAQTPVSPLRSALTNMVRELAATANLRPYMYRIVKQGSDGRVDLQPVNPASGAPDLGPTKIMAGQAGDEADYANGTVVVVQLIDGDQKLPRVTSFEDTVPTNRRIDATSHIDLGEGGNAAARKADPVHCGYIVLTSLGVPVQYFPGDIAPSTANQQAATTAANNISGTVFPLFANGLGGVIVAGSEKTRIE